MATQPERDGVEHDPASTPAAVLAAQALFLFSALFWLGLAVYTILALDPNEPNMLTTMWTIGVLMLLNTAAMIWVGLGLGRRERRFFWGAVALVVVNLVLSITDQMGALDWFALALSAGMLGLLLATRRLYGN